MKYRKFSDLGWNVSEIGLGCWQIGECWSEVSEHGARDLEDISSLLPKINSIYDELIKPDVHNRW